MPSGRKFAEANAKVNHENPYAPDDALALAKELSFAKFDETVEVHIRLGIDPRHSDQQVRDTVILPRGLGKTVKVLVFAEGDGARLATEAGADYVGADELIDKIQNEGWLDFDVVISVPELMGKVGKLGRFLGPRGLMPNPKVGTVTQADDLPRAIDESKGGKIEYRNDKTGNIHVPIGKTSFEVDALKENFYVLMEAIIKSRPAAIKGTYLRKIVVTTTMGPSIKIDPIAVVNM